jgi:hypothetical protein
MQRFVILEHDHPFLHWDLMLETGDVLRTWRLAHPPEPGRSIKATALGDHRRMYLDYEGPVSGDRGQVTRWDGGTFQWKNNKPNLVAVQLEGERLKGTVLLVHFEESEWALTFAEESSLPDAPA